MLQSGQPPDDWISLLEEARGGSRRLHEADLQLL